MKAKILITTIIPYHFQKFIPQGKKLPPFQAQSFWIKALQKLNCQVKVFVTNQTRFLPRGISLKINQFIQLNSPLLYEKMRLALNRYYFLNPENYLRSFSLLQLIKDWSPQYLFLTGGISELQPWVFQKAHKMNLKIILLHGVSPQAGSTRVEKRSLPFFDWVITNDPGHAQEWQKLGAKKALCLPYAGIDSKFHQKLKPSQKLSSDVCFVGTLTSRRQKELIFLHQKLPQADLRVWGFVPPFVGLFKKLKPLYQGEAWGRKMVKIFSSTKIALNFQPEHIREGGNMRTFEIPGCGAFQLANRLNPAWFKISQEAATFKNSQDFADKILYYLKNESERLTIAQAGYRRTHRDHTYEKRFKKLFQLIS